MRSPGSRRIRRIQSNASTRPSPAELGQVVVEVLVEDPPPLLAGEAPEEAVVVPRGGPGTGRAELLDDPEELLPLLLESLRRRRDELRPRGGVPREGLRPEERGAEE